MQTILGKNDEIVKIELVAFEANDHETDNAKLTIKIPRLDEQHEGVHREFYQQTYVSIGELISLRNQINSALKEITGV